MTTLQLETLSRIYSQQGNRCRGRVTHLSFDKASNEAERLNEIDPGTPAKAYRCRHCHCYHVGRKRGRCEK